MTASQGRKRVKRVPGGAGGWCGGGGVANDGVEGEEEGEDGAVVGGGLAAADVEFAAMALHDFFADPEAETGAGDALGGEEGVEDAGLDFGAHAAGVVGDGDGDAGLAGAPVGGFAFAHEEAASAGHDVERVADEVGDDLTYFSVEAVNFAAGAAAAFDADVGVVD